MSKIYLISDTHFGHANVIKYSDRPYSNVQQMDNELIKNWNNVVRKDDIVYFLGDFCMGGKELIAHYTQQLQGRKRIVLGNHDRNAKLYLEAGFEYAFPHPIIIEDFYILSHKPQYLSAAAPYVNIHGHLHTINQELMLGDKNLYYNVSVEQINYRPIDFNEIKKYYKE